MFFTRKLGSLALAALLLCSSSSAVPHFDKAGRDLPILDRRDGTSANVTNTTGAFLEPIVPPSVNENALSTLAIGKNITLAWAGSAAGSSSKRMLKRDGATMTQSNLTLLYPAVPLDHSNYISGISCSKTSLTATLTSAAYTFAKKNWKTNSKIVFITAVDGCGVDNVNHVFLAKSVVFSDSKKSFTAQGSPVLYKDIAAYVDIQFGDIGTHSLKRAIDKRWMFEPHELHRRFKVSLDMNFKYYVSDFLGTDADAPWEDAALLFKWSKQGGKQDLSWLKGEAKSSSPGGHHKRENETALEEQSALEERAAGKVTSAPDWGAAFYCVECGIVGKATIWGELSISLLELEVTKAQIGFGLILQAGINLGMRFFVQYEKKWEKELERVDIPDASIAVPDFVDLGAFVSLNLEATATVSATGTLLLGASVEWDNIDIMLDFLDFSNSHAQGFKPIFNHRVDAAGEVKLELSLGMPIKLGLGVQALGVWSADVSIVDTPAIVGEGSYEIAMTVNADGEVVPDFNGGCQGIAWNIHFENKLQAVAEAKWLGERFWDLIKPYESPPIAEGCLGYEDSDPDNPNTGSAAGMIGNGLTIGGPGLSGTISASGCRSTKVNPNAGSATCKKFYKQANVFGQFNVYKQPTYIKEITDCAAICLKTKDCLSFAHDGVFTCWMYKSAYRKLGITAKSGKPNLTFWDKTCFIPC